MLGLCVEILKEGTVALSGGSDCFHAVAKGFLAAIIQWAIKGLWMGLQDFLCRRKRSVAELHVIEVWSTVERKEKTYFQKGCKAGPQICSSEPVEPQFGQSHWGIVPVMWYF